MFITEYSKLEEEYHCLVIEEINGEQQLIAHLIDEDFSYVFTEAMTIKENYYNYEFSDKEIELAAQTAVIMVELNDNPSSSELFNELVEVQAELQKEYIDSGFDEIRRRKDSLLVDLATLEEN